MIEFASLIETRLLGIAQEVVGTGDPQVKTFSDHLEDTDIADMPLVVVTVRTIEEEDDPEMGVPHSSMRYVVHIYYLDIEQSVYATGKVRRDNIVGRLEQMFGDNFNLRNLDHTDDSGVREYVYDCGVDTIVRDSGGSTGAYSFTGEIYGYVLVSRA